MLRWGERVAGSGAGAGPGAEGDPPEPSEPAKEPLSCRQRRWDSSRPSQEPAGVGGTGRRGPSEPRSRLRDLISFFIFSVIQFARLGRRERESERERERERE